MAKRSKDEDEELSAQETGSEDSPPPQKKPKKSSEVRIQLIRRVKQIGLIHINIYYFKKKAVKKSKAKVSKESDEEPPSTSKSKKGNLAKVCPYLFINIQEYIIEQPPLYTKNGKYLKFFSRSS